MLCKFKDRGGGTRKRQMSLALTRTFLWTQAQRHLQAVPLVGLFVSLSSPSPGTRPLEVVDLSQARPPPTQVEFSTFFFFFQTLIKAPAGQQWIHCLLKSKIQAVSGRHWLPPRAPAAHPTGWAVLGAPPPTVSHPPPPTARVLLQLWSFAESVVMHTLRQGPRCPPECLPPVPSRATEPQTASLLQ